MPFPKRVFAACVASVIALLLAAVINPLPFTVKLGIELLDPKDPVFELTVDKVAATAPFPEAVTSPVKEVIVPTAFVPLKISPLESV